MRLTYAYVAQARSCHCVCGHRSRRAAANFNVYRQSPLNVYRQSPLNVYRQPPLNVYRQSPFNVYRQPPLNVYRQPPLNVHRQPPLNVYRQSPLWSSQILQMQSSQFCNILLPLCWFIDTIWYIWTWYDTFVNCKWVDTFWQQYSTHLHTNSI